MSLQSDITLLDPYSLLKLLAYYGRLLITLANSLDPDQTRQNVGPALDPSCLILMLFPKEYFGKNNNKNVIWNNICREQKIMEHYPAEGCRSTFTHEHQQYTHFCVYDFHMIKSLVRLPTTLSICSFLAHYLKQWCCFRLQNSSMFEH